MQTFGIILGVILFIGFMSLGKLYRFVMVKLLKRDPEPYADLSKFFNTWISANHLTKEGHEFRVFFLLYVIVFAVIMYMFEVG